MKTLLAPLPRPEVEAAKVAAAIAAAAQPPAEPAPDVRSSNGAADYAIASRFASVFHQALGSAPRFDYITNFDFDNDWRGDNNWNNADDQRFPLDAYVYYAVFETRTHYFIHYAAFHPRDYKGGDKRGAMLSQAIRLGVSVGGQYDPTGRAAEAVLAHENDLEGTLVVAEKNGPDAANARLTLVETLAHNNYRKFTANALKLDGVRPHLFIESQGHGIEAWHDDVAQRKFAQKGFLVYTLAGNAENPEQTQKHSVGYELVSTYDTFWQQARSGKNESFGDQHDYGIVTARFVNGAEEAVRHLRL